MTVVPMFEILLGCEVSPEASAALSSPIKQFGEAIVSEASTLTLTVYLPDILVTFRLPKYCQPSKFLPNYVNLS